MSSLGWGKMEGEVSSLKRHIRCPKAKFKKLKIISDEPSDGGETLSGLKRDI
jgi:hypothetical protein